MFRRKKSGWVYAGIFCEQHLSQVVKVLGTVKTEAVDKESVEMKDRCCVHGCKEYVSFTVFREGTPP